MKKKLQLGLVLFALGFIGVLSMLTGEVPLPEEAQKVLSEVFTPWQLKLLILINPTILLIITVIVGTLFYDKIHFKLPLIENLVYSQKKKPVKGMLTYGITGGLVSGLLIITMVILFMPIMPADFIELGNKFKPGPVVRFLYGGITEEILMRFGIMTLLVWLLNALSGKLTNSIYWIGILISAVVFGILHLPVVFAMIENPTWMLIAYIIVANTLGGIVFGWLYWKKSLETAMIAHMFAHVTMLLLENLLNL